MARWRRLFIWIGFPGHVGVLGIAFAFFLEVMGAIAFFALALVLSLAIFLPIVLLLTLWRMGSALMRLIWVVLNTSRQLKIAVWTPSTLDGADVLLVHLSDLHMANAVPYELKVNPHEYSGHLREVDSVGLRQRCRALIRAALIEQPSAVAMTGDLTDTGHESEWKLLVKIAADEFKSASNVEVLAVPGNHDVNLNVGESPDVSGEGRLRRQRLAGMYLWNLRRKVEAMISEENRQPFPFSTTINRSDNRFNVVALDSCRYESRFILSNAIGRMGRDQLIWLERHLASCAGPLIILMHHHLALPARRISIMRPISSATELMKLPIDVRPLIEKLLKYSRAKGNTVLVLHGHQHEELRFQVSDRRGGVVSISGLASSTLGALVPDPQEGNLRLDGIPRFARIGFNSDRGWLIDVKQS